MFAGPRFTVYRRILAGFLSAGFKDHPIEPLAAPVDTEIDHVAHDELGPTCRCLVSASRRPSSRPTTRNDDGCGSASR